MYHVLPDTLGGGGPPWPSGGQARLKHLRSSVQLVLARVFSMSPAMPADDDWETESEVAKSDWSSIVTMMSPSSTDGLCDGDGDGDGDGAGAGAGAGDGVVVVVVVVPSSWRGPSSQ